MHSAPEHPPCCRHHESVMPFPSTHIISCNDTGSLLLVQRLQPCLDGEVEFQRQGWGKYHHFLGAQWNVGQIAQSNSTDTWALDRQCSPAIDYRLVVQRVIATKQVHEQL